MADLRLPADLLEFLRSGKRLEYDQSMCEAGLITLLTADQLKLQFFPMGVRRGSEDPHAGESGCYLVKGVSLIASCDNYGPEGLLLWLPLDRRYGLWDGDHGTLFVFGPDVGWPEIASDMPRYINAEWGIEDSASVADLAPWLFHPYNLEQICHPLPDLPEWYETKWVRRGKYKKGVQLRYPEEIRVRLENDGDQWHLTFQSKPAQEAAVWSPPEAISLSSDAMRQLEPHLDDGFWKQASVQPEPGGEPATIWSISGFRAERYHALTRFYEENRSEGDAVHELGKRLARLAKLRCFEREQ